MIQCMRQALNNTTMTIAQRILQFRELAVVVFAFDISLDGLNCPFDSL